MARILNVFLCTIMTFLLAFAWVTYCLKNTKIALLLSAITAICFCYLFWVLSKQTERKRNAQNARKKTLQNFFLFLKFNENNANTFAPALQFYGYAVQSKDFDNVLIQKEGKTFVSFCFETEKLSEERMRRAVILAKREKCEKLLIFGNRAENALLEIASLHIPTRFVDLENCYRLLERAGKLPSFPSVKKTQRKIVATVAFNKKRFGWYLGGAVFTLATAAVSLLKIHLLVWASALFVLAAYSLLNKKYNATPTDVTLD